MFPNFAILPYYLVGKPSFLLISHPIISIFLSLPLKLRLDMGIQRYSAPEIRQENHVTPLVQVLVHNIQSLRCEQY